MAQGANMKCAVRAVAGRAFEDILDGYFPLSESVRQMMVRHGFTSMWITVLHAPVMTLKGLAPTDPVPFSLPKTYAGMIEHMALGAASSDNRVHLVGVGNWFWVDGRDEVDTFPPSTRLGEPAFVRGIGIGEADAEAGTRMSVALARLDPSEPIDRELEAATRRLGWQASRAWRFETGVPAIRRSDDRDVPSSLFGRAVGTDKLSREVASLPASASLSDWDHVLVDVSPDHPDRDALEFAQRL
ncbi:hypothetical protein [Amorphus sp. 3PC139-8]|uniref:hypothetical protein n=1 Tax=Amorphus sp. 3PC139-8 TaxID=2735676 RepID=UPI00345CB45D